jgi:hypothetical protein
MPLPGPLGDSPMNLAVLSGLFQVASNLPQPNPVTVVLPEPKPRPIDSVTAYHPTIVSDAFLGTAPLVHTDVLQGMIGNCPVTAVLAAMAITRPSVLKGMIVKITGQQPTYTPVFPAPPPVPSFNYYFKVTFPGSGPILASPLVYRLPRPPQTMGPPEVMYAHSPGETPSWVSVLEKAYAFKKDTNPNPLLRGYSSLDGGGKGLDPLEVMNDIAGTGAQWVVDPSVVQPDERGPHPWTAAHLAQVFARANQVPTIAASRSEQEKIDPLPIYKHHDYAVKGMLPNGKVQLYNCHDLSSTNDHKNPALTMAEFQKAFLMVVLKP